MKKKENMKKERKRKKNKKNERKRNMMQKFVSLISVLEKVWLAR